MGWAHVYRCVWRPEVDAGSLSQTLHHIFGSRVSPWIQRLLDSSWLASSFGSDTSTSSACREIRDSFYMVSGTWTLVLMLVQEVFHAQTHLPSSAFLTLMRIFHNKWSLSCLLDFSSEHFIDHFFEQNHSGALKTQNLLTSGQALHWLIDITVWGKGTVVWTVVCKHCYFQNAWQPGFPKPIKSGPHRKSHMTTWQYSFQSPRWLWPSWKINAFRADLCKSAKDLTSYTKGSNPIVLKWSPWFCIPMRWFEPHSFF